MHTIIPLGFRGSSRQTSVPPKNQKWHGVGILRCTRPKVRIEFSTQLWYLRAMPGVLLADLVFLVNRNMGQITYYDSPKIIDITFRNR